jgi:hypothetical protein
MHVTPPIFGMGIVVVMAIIVPVIVLLVVGLSNRHTRGATKGVAIAIGVLIGLMFLWRMAAVPSFNHSAFELQRALLEQQAAQMEQIAANLEQSVDSDANRQMAQQYRAQAEGFRQQMTHLGPVPQQVNFAVPSWVALSPVVLLVFMVIVFLVFKHAGPTMGFAALGVPFLLLFVGYSSLERVEVQTADEIRMQSLAQLEGHAADIIVQASAEEEHDIAQEHGEIPMNGEQSEDPEEADDSPESEAKDSSETPAADVVPPPDWVKYPPKSVPNVYRRVVSSSWYPSEAECRSRIDPQVEQAVSNYLHQTVGGTGMGLVQSLPQLGITSDYIRDNLISNEFAERRGFAHEDGLTNLHVLLEIDSADSDFMTAQWRAHARMHRIAWVRNLMVGVMVSLAGVLGLIKVDTATKGYYTKRLFIGVPAAIIGGVMLIVATAEWWDRYF